MFYNSVCDHLGALRGPNVNVNVTWGETIAPDQARSHRGEHSKPYSMYLPLCNSEQGPSHASAAAQGPMGQAM